MSTSLKKQRVYTPSPIENVPDDVLGHIMSFCDDNRYLTLGIVNNQFNRVYSADKQTSDMGFIESDTAKVDRDGINIPPDSRVMSTIAGSIHLSRLIDRAMNRGGEWDPFLVEDAAKTGDEEFFKWLSDKDFFWFPCNAYASAAECGNLDMMKFFMSSGHGIPDERCKMSAIKDGHNHILEWLNHIETTEMYVLSNAVNSNDVSTVRNIYDINKNHYEWILTDAISNGAIDVVEYLLEFGLVPTERDIHMGVRMGRKEILWVMENSN